MNTALAESSSAGWMSVSQKGIPSVWQMSRIVSRVIPGRAPLARGGVQTSFCVRNPEQVAARPFGCKPARVQQQGFVRSGAVRFGAGQDLREFVAGLKTIQRLVRIDSHSRSRHPPGRDLIRRGCRERVCGKNDARVASPRWRITAFARPTRDDNSEDRVGQPVRFHEFVRDLAQPGRCEWECELQEFRTPLQPLQVLPPAERLAVAHQHRLKQAVTVKE